jgi:hypothetical protein
MGEYERCQEIMLHNATWAKETLNNNIYIVHKLQSTESSVTKYE